MSATTFDLDAYFERIGYSGSRRATIDTLAAVHLAHVQSIPFENLNPLLKWPVRLDARSLQQKLVRNRRGGYCFEQNLLFSHALGTLGFQVTCLAARVQWNHPDGAVNPRSHMLLLVHLQEGPYIADVGFGGVTLTAPLKLESNIEQPTPHEPFRLVTQGDVFVEQVKIAGEWKSLYRFDLTPQVLPDYEVSNWYLSNHPESQFVNNLIAARPDPDRRYGLRNNDLAVHHTNGTTERRLLTSADELRAALEELFHITLPDAPELRATLERLAARAA